MKVIYRVSWLALAVALAHSPALAQATDIVADTIPGNDLGTNVSTIGNVTTIDQGTLSGTNLYHSFANFDLAAGDVAQWVYSSGDPGGIANVINRVTGGTPSSIAGMLDSTALPNADFYFINPAGVLFGAGAEVNVPAAAHFSTSSELRFANGDIFSIATPNGSTLSMAAPQSFGFLGGEGDIALTDIENGASTFLPGGGALTVAAADIMLSNAFIGSNALALAAVGEIAAEVALDGTSADLLQGMIGLGDGSWLQTWPGGCLDACLGNAGTIRLHAGSIDISSSSIVADFDAAVDSGGDRYVSLTATETVTVSDGFVMSNGYDAASAGAVLISAGTLVSLSNAQLSTYTAGSGDAGQLLVAAEGIALDSSTLISETYGDGAAGSISLDAGSWLYANGANITSVSFAAGDAGQINLAAGDTMEIAGYSLIQSDARSSGESGAIQLDAGELLIRDASFISTSTAGLTDGGSISVDVLGTFVLRDASALSASSGYSGEATTGSGGSISVHARDIEFDQGFVDTTAFTEGVGGLIAITADETLTLNFANISSNSEAGGSSGDILVSAGEASLYLSDISSNANGTGDGGSVTVMVDGSLSLATGHIVANAGEAPDLIGQGNGGDILVSAGSLTMAAGDGTSLGSLIASNSYDDGAGGTVTVQVSGHVDMADASRISANSFGNGLAGDVIIAADSASLDESRISSNAFGDGDGGEVQVTVSSALEMTGLSLIESNAGYPVDEVLQHGLGRGGDVQVLAGSLDLDNSYIRSSSFSDGDGGSIVVSVAGNINLANLSGINANSLGVGQAGDIVVEAGSVTVTDSIIRSSALGQGDGGSVEVSTTGALLLDHASISTSAGVAGDLSQGNAGTIDITASSIVLDAGTIESTAFAGGNGGSVRVEAEGHILMTGGSITENADHVFESIDGAQIASNSFGTGHAGDIEISAGTMTLEGLSSIGSNASGAGDGGNVAIAVDGLLDMHQSGIFTDAGDAADGVQPAGDAGTIFVAAGSLDMVISGIGSSATDGGNGGAIGLAVDGAVTMEQSNVASNSSGTGDAGIVAIEAASLTMTDFSFITSDAILDGDAGLVLVDVAGDIRLSSSRISSNVGESDAGNSTGDAGAILVSARNLIMDDGSIYSISFGNGDSGLVSVELTGVLEMTDSIISSDAAGELGNGGALFIEAASVKLERSSIAADTYADGDAGLVDVQVVGALTLLDESFISSDTLFGSGSGGDVTVQARDILLDGGSFISSVAYADGDGGFVDVTATNSLVMRGETAISTNVYGDGLGGAVFVNSPSILLTAGSMIASTAGELASGDAGDVLIEAGDLVMDGGSSIASDSDGSGESGFVDLAVARLDMSDGARISTQSMNSNPAGYIAIVADDVRLSGLGTAIASENLNTVEGGDNAAGSVLVTAGHVEIAEGARVATNSLTGIAGDITFSMPAGSLLILEGVTNPGVIETSSGPGTGGIISISQPLAIISNGGTISALGESGGANVQIDTNYFIVSSDRLNTVEVDGTLAFTNAIYDVSAGTVDADLAIVDASGVLRNQCSAARASGELSQLQLRSIGPLGPARGRETEPVEKAVGSSGGCH